MNRTPPLLGGLLDAGVDYVTGVPCSLLAPTFAALAAVLDNGMHESTGGQRTVAPSRLGELMSAAGYAQVRTVRTAGELPDEGLLPSPTGVCIFIAPHTAVAPRVVPAPPALVERARAWLGHPR